MFYYMKETLHNQIKRLFVHEVDIAKQARDKAGFSVIAMLNSIIHEFQ